MKSKLSEYKTSRDNAKNASNMCCLVADRECTDVNLEDNIGVVKFLSLENQTSQAHSHIGIWCLLKVLLTLTKRLTTMTITI